jgi:hypothetical protein
MKYPTFLLDFEKLFGKWALYYFPRIMRHALDIYDVILCWHFLGHFWLDTSIISSVSILISLNDIFRIKWSSSVIIFII